MTWKSELEELIRERWRHGQSFTIAQVYEANARFAASHPENHHIHDKLRQTLQYLRDEGVIAFVDETGTYLRLR